MGLDAPFHYKNYEALSRHFHAKNIWASSLQNLFYLNKSNSSVTEAPLLDLSITNGIVSSKINDK